ncbi:FHA domain containing protein [Lunatimonas lonarensis]|uniref:FHA domain containing protein n=1 Tax=Lunatimonas lonarensis TaxID=1232681 RepID=R7ZLN3_9BACT|nr:phosphopeptide-binding protein [Lunatimonas lonarensis]EON74982.1 FHA domain containing protein [Lunatimonas lonarensis]
MNRSIFPLFIGILFAFCACSGRVSEDRGVYMETEEAAAGYHEGLEVVLQPTSSFPDAMIEMYRPLGNEVFPEGKVEFEFNIKNYPFGSKRPFMLAINGTDGEEISYAVFSKNLGKGTYRAVAYLTDEQGLLLKEFGNYVDRDFRVGDSRAFPAADEPYLLLNRPRDGERIPVGEGLVVDFLVVWGDLKADGLEAKLSVGDFEYRTQDQQVIRLTNLAKGEHVVRLDLLRKDGKELSNPFSSVSRRVLVE